MNDIKLVPLKDLGFHFVQKEFLPEGKDEYYLRNQQAPEKKYRFLTSEEINTLKNQGNKADNWNNIQVTERFSPNRVKNCRFYGLNRIGDIDDVYLDFHDLHQPAGLYNSTIVSCEIGSNVAINNVNYMSHYIVGDTSILFNINEILATNYAKFGNGIIKDGENEEVRIELELSNENGNRAVLPFDGMLAADAWIWSKYRDDLQMMKKLKEITQSSFDSSRGYYGTIGECTVIKNCRILKDVKIGSHAYFKGCNKLKNLTINSSKTSSTQLGEGIELVNGIVGYGCRIFYGVKAIRFVMEDYSTLKYGARLINSLLGANSTISCCEVLNALIFPGHEQHHNNSFLCATTIKGQSNIASGATIGSNHNSRANDGEIVAGRGFWPGLCTSLKHNSLFSSFNLVAKGTYPAEIKNPFPFSLISNNETDGHLMVIPAYWFQYNLYALARNSWKYGVRDQRSHKELFLEFDYLAPDTISEMITAMEMLSTLVSDTKEFKNSDYDNSEDFLVNNPDFSFEVNFIENTKRSTVLLKCGKAYKLYKDFVLYYVINVFLQKSQMTKKTVSQLLNEPANPSNSVWVNVGGQLIKDKDLSDLKGKIKNGEVTNWDSIHQLYKQYTVSYNEDKFSEALHIYNTLFKNKPIAEYFDDYKRICTYIKEQTFFSRQKDYFDDFRLCTYENEQEMEEVVGKFENNSFIKVVNELMEENIKKAEENLR